MGKRQKMAKYAEISRFSMRQVFIDNLQLTSHKKTVSTGIFSIFKAEKSEQGQPPARSSFGPSKSCFVFIDDGLEVNSQAYLNMLPKNLLPWLTESFENK